MRKLGKVRGKKRGCTTTEGGQVSAGVSERENGNIVKTISAHKCGDTGSGIRKERSFDLFAQPRDR